MGDCYVFNPQYVGVYDITEDEYRQSKGWCPRDKTRWGDKTRIDPWNLVDGDLSKVGINNQNVYCPDLRQSVSIKDRFEIYFKGKLNYLFEKYKIGIGSKHIYVKDDFIKPHRDKRLPDKDGLPHTMTLVVFRDTGYAGGELIVNGKDVIKEITPCKDESYNERNRIVLFSIDCVHEVRKIISGTRHSFVFPVYGIYNPITMLERKLSKESYNIIDKINEELDDFEQNRGLFDYREDRQYAILQGLIESLSDSDLTRIVVKYRQAIGDWVPYERRESISSDSEDECVNITNITYTTLSGEKKEVVMEDEDYLELGNVSDTKIRVKKESIEDRDKRLKKKVIKDIREYLIQLNMRQKLELKKLEDNPLPSKQMEQSLIPKDKFIVLLTGSYYFDSNIKTLCKIDNWILSQLQNNNCKCSFVIGNKLNDVIPTYKYQNGEFVRMLDDMDMDCDYIYNTDDPITKTVDNLYVEFDDQGGYDPIYNRTYGMLIVDSINK